jgi:hypothetical protein
MRTLSRGKPGVENPPQRHNQRTPALGQRTSAAMLSTAEDALTDRLMDGGIRTFYVNATAIGGLKSAARIARSVGHHDLQDHGIRQAAELTDAYRERMSVLPEGDESLLDQRTLINALHPTEAADRASIESLLSASWNRRVRGNLPYAASQALGFPAAHGSFGSRAAPP